MPGSPYPVLPYDVFQAPGTAAALSSYEPIVSLSSISVREYAKSPAHAAVLGNGTSKPLSGYYGTLAAAQADYPHAIALTDELDWAILQAAINAGANKTVSTAFDGAAGFQPGINIPAGWYKINEQLTMNVSLLLGAYTTIYSNGGVIIQQTDVTKDILVWSNAYDVKIDNITFAGGRRQVNAVNVGTTDQSRIQIFRCDFRQSDSYAVYVECTGQPNYNVMLTIAEGTRFDACKQLLYSNAAPCKVRDVWMTGTINTPNNVALIVNKGWMLLDNFWGSPQLDVAQDNRWIDNYSSVFIDRSRFGGENAGFTGGIPIVFNYAGPDSVNGFTKPTTISITNSALSSSITTADADACNIVLMSDVPQVIIMRGNQHFTHSPKIGVGTDATINLGTYFGTFPADYRWKIEIEPSLKWEDEILSIQQIPDLLLTSTRVIHNIGMNNAFAVNAISTQDIVLVNGKNNDIDIQHSGRFVRISGPSAAFTLTGFKNGWSNRELTVFSTVAFALTIQNDNAADSTAANRIWTKTGADVVLTAQIRTAHFFYDKALARWILDTYN